ncbi:MAG: hypothetical protein ABW148_18580 [Sedimenticola sp.]
MKKENKYRDGAEIRKLIKKCKIYSAGSMMDSILDLLTDEDIHDINENLAKVIVEKLSKYKDTDAGKNIIKKWGNSVFEEILRNINKNEL